MRIKPGVQPRAALFRSILPLLLPLTLLLAPSTHPAAAQSLGLFSLDTRDFPTIRGKVLALDASGQPITDLDPDDFRLTENGVERRIFSLTCPLPKPVEPISSVLTIDVSGSMGENTSRNLRISQAAAREWIGGLPLGVSEAAITSFSDESRLLQDFTIDARKLLDAVNSLTPISGTNYDSALIAYQTGAIPVALRGRHKRVVVFLTDGLGDGNEAEIIRQAQAAGVTVYTVAVGFPAPQILKNVAQRTGGLWFENVASEAEAIAIYRAILQSAQGGEPCEIVWESGPACDTARAVVLEASSRGLSTSAWYAAPARSVVLLDVDRTEIRFGTAPAGSPVDRTVQLTATNGPVTVTAITSSNPRITVVNAPPPSFTVTPGQPYDVTIRFLPVDDGYEYAEITIETDACAKSIYAAGGELQQGGNVPEIRLVVPNGGERFPVGSVTDIRWSGVLPTDTVRLEYSTNGGSSWDPITDKGTGLSYRWRVPNTPSETCLARVTVGGGPASGPSLNPVAITVYDSHTDAVNVARFRPDGRYVATGSQDSYVAIWEALSGNDYRRFSVEGPVLDLDFIPDGSKLAVAAGGSPTRWWVYDVALGQTGSPVVESGLTAIAFDQTGANVVTGNASGTIRIWSAAGGSGPIRSFNTRLGRIVSVDVGPTGDILVAGAGNDTVMIVSSSGGEIERFPYWGITGHTGQPTSARFSRDGTEVLSSAVNDATILWRRGVRAPLLRLPGYHEEGAVSPDESTLATGEWNGNNPPVRLRRSSDAQLVATALAHTAPITTVDFSPNGSYLVSAGRDDSAIVWEITAPVATTGSDLSDNLWAIVAAEAATVNVDFGKVIVGRSRDSVVTGLVRNTGSVPVRVSGLRIAGNDPSRFGVVSGFPPFELPPGGTGSVELRFSPNAIGPFNGTAEIITDIDTLRSVLSGEGVAPALEILARFVDFGKVEVGSTKDTTVTVVLRNVGSSPLFITDVREGGPDDASFALTAGGGPFSLPPGGTSSMRLTFSPSETGRTSGSLLVEHDGPGSPATVQLFGEGICLTDITRASATIGAAEASAGDTVNLPVTLVALDPPLPGSPGTPTTGALDFAITLGLNRSLLLPLDPSAIVRTTIDSIYVRFSGRWDLAGNRIIWDGSSPRFLAALGNAESTDIRVEQTTWTTGCAPDVAGTAGTFRLLDLCREGGTRLFSEGGHLRLDPGRPNPATEQTLLTVEVLEPGPTTLTIYAYDGAAIAVPLDDVLTPGRYEIPLDVTGWAVGMYVVRLRTSSSTVENRLYVVR